VNRDDFQTAAGMAISDAEHAALQAYADLIVKWNPRINLVSRSTLPDLWQRHLVDSAQIYPMAPENVPIWADFGSGGGMPGIILAILSKERSPDTRHVLVESDQRKAAFLIEAIRVTGSNARVLSSRIEALPPIGAGVVTARALAALPELLAWLHPHMAEDAVALLPKGAAYQAEVDAAAAEWDFKLKIAASRTDADARILRLTEVNPRS